jgi:hypothetical protein
MKLIYIFIIAVLSLPLRTIAQQKLFDGTRKDLTTNSIEPISYSSTTNSSQGIFGNRFSIFQKSNSAKPDTIYVIDINFNKTNNTIIITCLDKTTNQSQSRSIEFKVPAKVIRRSDVKPIYCVKNYLFNDTLLTVTNDNKADILFTIADTINPLIFLHQIVSIDGTKRLDLDKFRKTYLTAHLSHAKDYWKWYKKDLLDKVQIGIDIEDIKEREKRRLILQSKIEREKALIISDKDSIIEVLNKKTMTNKLSDTIANTILQQAFALSMDNVFTEYFNKRINANTGVIGNYKIYVRTDNSKRIVKSQVPESAPYYNEQFIAINDFIEHLPLTNEEVSICSENPMSRITRNHITRFDRNINEAIDLKLSIDSIFNPILNSIDLVLKKICSEKTKITTIYNYSYKIESRSEWQKWIVRSNKITDSHDSIITKEDNILDFYNKNIKRKRGKYDVRLITTKFNDRIFGPALDSVQFKYKFITRVGFNVGTFIPIDKSFNVNNVNVQFWNLFVIHHHFGIFAGSTNSPEKLPVTKFEKYNEGGIYLAPGRCFYFKMGLSQGKNTAGDTSYKAIAGASLIFPIFQIEGGYNFAFESPFVMAGINIPFNR